MAVNEGIVEAACSLQFIGNGVGQYHVRTRHQPQVQIRFVGDADALGVDYNQLGATLACFAQFAW